MGELVISQKSQMPTVPSEHEMMVYQTMALQAVESNMYKGIGGKAGVMMIMLGARELGIPPMQALNGGLNIINGKVEVSARMMGALIRRAGHQFTVKDSTDEQCTIVGKRGDTGETQEASFSLAEAQRAGLIKPGGGWSKFPKDMCFARALSRLARQLFSDVIGIGYVEGEIGHSEPKLMTIQPIEVDPAIEIQKEEDLLNGFIELFTPEHREHASEWLDVVRSYSKWGLEEAIKKVTADIPRMMEKFLAWKQKNKE